MADTCLRLRISHEPTGLWLMTGLPRHAPFRFGELAEGLDYAKQHCAAAPAMIEVVSDGIYVAAYQAEGLAQPPLPTARPEGHGGAVHRRSHMAATNLAGGVAFGSRPAGAGGGTRVKKNHELPPVPAIVPADMFDPQSVMRLRIFSFKMLMVIPVSLVVASHRGVPILSLMTIFCGWHAIFAALAALCQQRRPQSRFLTAWDEAAAFLALALFARLADSLALT